MHFILLVAALASAASADRATLHWDTDIRPALEGVICVTVEEYENRKFFQPKIAAPPACPGALPEEQPLRGVAELMAGEGVVLRARAGGPDRLRETPPDDPQSAARATEDYRRHVLSSPAVLERIMPRLQALLAAAGASCPDCPGPQSNPAPRTVRWADLLPYVLAHAWVDSVDTEGHAQIFFCAGKNGLRELPVDRSLAEAGFDMLMGNRTAIQAVQAAAKPAIAGCRGLPEAEGRVTRVRKALRDSLVQSAELESAVLQRADLLGPLGLSCTDCAAPAP